MDCFSCAVIEILTSVQVCDCAVYKGSFRKHHLPTVKTPWWWHPWSAETCTRRPL